MSLAPGMLSLLSAFAAFIPYLRISYQTEEDSLGQDPCITAAVIQILLLMMAGFNAFE